MSVLVDTSVWVRFLSRQAPYAAELSRLLGLEEVSTHEFVLGELLMGETADRRELLNTYTLMDRAPVIAHHEVAALVRHRRLAGRGIGWVDVHLLASALVGRVTLWTADLRLAEVAHELGVGYQPSREAR